MPNKIDRQFTAGAKLPEKDYVDGDATEAGLNEVLAKVNLAPTVFSTVAGAEAAEYSEPETVAIAETSQFYIYDSGSALTRDGVFVLNAGGTGRLVSTMFQAVADSLGIGVSISPTAKLLVKGSGNTSATDTFDFQNSDGDSVLKGLDDGAIGGVTLDTGIQVSTSVRMGNGAGVNDSGTGSNVSIGNLAGNAGITGNSRTLVGNLAGEQATVSGTTAFGNQAGRKGATAFGYLAAPSSVYSSTVAIGGTSLYSATSAANTSGLGIQSGRYYGSGTDALTIVTDGVFLGADTRAKENSSVNEIVIGKSAIGNGSNTATIGNDNTTDTYLAGNLHVDGFVTQDGIYGGIHVHDASTAQTIAAGAGYTKSTAFTDNNISSNMTSDATNDKITFTQTGVYDINANISASSDTNNMELFATVFLDGVEQSQCHTTFRLTQTSDIQSGSFGGQINVDSVPMDLDFRLRTDDGGAVDVTVSYANLKANYIGKAQ